MDQFAKETIPISLEEEMRKSYLDYAMSVIVGRALPDVRDGLKPVHRRVLFAMHEMNNVWNRPFVKCARVVGEVMGKYHPHGDASIYDTLVRMAQDFSLRYMLVDGQGNFGSIDGDGAAAMRYTECRLDKIANELLADIEKETVDFDPNYDGKEKEPSVLPTRIPNLLINGSSGIAVGMATNIPPHNITEVINGALHVLSNADCTIDELIELIPAPDFPTGGIIYGVSGVRDGYRTGALQKCGDGFRSFEGDFFIMFPGAKPISVAGDNNCVNSASRQLLNDLCLDALLCRFVQCRLAGAECLAFVERDAEIAICAVGRYCSVHGDCCRIAHQGGRDRIGDERSQLAIAAGQGIRRRPIAGAPAQAVLAARDAALVVLAVGGGRCCRNIGVALGVSGKSGGAQQEAEQAGKFTRHIS